MKGLLTSGLETENTTPTSAGYNNFYLCDSHKLMTCVPLNLTTLNIDTSNIFLKFSNTISEFLVESELT